MLVKITECPNNRDVVGETHTLVDGSLRDRPIDGFEPYGAGWRNQRGTVAMPLEGGPVPDQAFKADGGKPNWFLLMSGKGCAAALAGVVRVLSFAVRPVAEGGKGYTEHSWRQVPNARERYEAALYRHLNKIALGELVDDESGESHWDHVATNALFLSELTKAGQ